MKMRVDSLVPPSGPTGYDRETEGKQEMYGEILHFILSPTYTQCDELGVLVM